LGDKTRAQIMADNNTIKIGFNPNAAFMYFGSTCLCYTLDPPEYNMTGFIDEQERKDHAPSEETIARQKARSESPLKKKKKRSLTAALGFSRPRITAPSHISKKDLEDLREDFK